MERLGYCTTTVTLDTVGHLLPSLEERIADALDVIYGGAKPRMAAPIRRLTTDS